MMIKSKWINFSDKQPKEEQEYLCVCDEGCYWLGMWQPWFGDENGEFCMVGTNHESGSIDVRYWQELPEMPSSDILESLNEKTLTN